MECKASWKLRGIRAPKDRVVLRLLKATVAIRNKYRLYRASLGVTVEGINDISCHMPKAPGVANSTRISK
jgi:hypothetical protein